MNPDNQTGHEVLIDEPVIETDSGITNIDFRAYYQLIEQLAQQAIGVSGSELKAVPSEKCYWDALTEDAIEYAGNIPVELREKPYFWSIGPKNCLLVFADFSPEVISEPVTLEEESQQIETAETADAQEKARFDIAEEVESLFRTTTGEDFEDGQDNEFAERLLKMVRDYGRPAICEIQHLIVHEKIKPELARETLRWLGSMDHEDTYDYRALLLKQAISNPVSTTIRDGANRGLAFMDDPNTIPDLKRAIEKEKSPILREFMKRTLIQLENTQKCLSF